MDFVSNYIKNILDVQLKEFGVSQGSRQKILANIHDQINSVLFHWEDIEFRKTILLIGQEEGVFYQPNAELDIKSFVVVAIRNSLFEVLASEAYADMGLKVYLPDSCIVEVTGEAIRYFSINRPETLFVTAETGFNDVYGGLPIKYPIAWNAINTLANTNKISLRFAKVIGKEDQELLLMLPEEVEKTLDFNNKVILNGYDSNFDEQLLRSLYLVKNYQSALFFTDCFKFATRNIDKLFRIIEFVLYNEKVFVTANYWISNGYVEKRKKLLKPSSSTVDMKTKLHDYNGISKKHKIFLKNLLNHF